MSPARNLIFRLSSLWITLLLCRTAFGGTELHVRLLDPLNSKSARSGDTVRAALLAPAEDGKLPAGSVLIASIKQVRPATRAESALVWLSFSSIQIRGFRSFPISAMVTSVDNARETVDDEGRIVGIAAAQALGSQADRGIAKLETNYSGLASILQAAKTALVKPVDPEINYDAGVEMTLDLLKPVNLSASDIPLLGVLQPFSSPSGLIAMVARQPLRTMAASPPRPSDLTNLLLIGTATQIKTAFAQAGWSSATALNEQSKLETFRALMEARGYKEGPVSLLLLEGRSPDFVFQKSNNTFAARHHLRIWQRPGTFDGLPIWLVAATHDIAIDFSDRDGTFIHKIDSHLDSERSKVVNDLLDTGSVRSLSIVERPRIPANMTNATGDPLITDGGIAVIMLGADGPSLVP